MTSEGATGAGPLPALQWFYNQLDDSIDRLKSSIAMVVHVVPGPRVESIGTGFFYSKDGWPFFVTAKHVIDQVQASIQTGRDAFAVVRGSKAVLPFSRLESFCFSELDIAVLPLWKSSKGSCSTFEFLDSSQVANRFSASSFFAFTGFPVSRNKTYTSSELKPHQRVITLPVPRFDALELASSPFIEFELGADLHDSSLRRTSLPFPAGLHGMSGGPVFQIDGPVTRPYPRLLAVGIAWLRTQHLKAVRFDLLDVLLAEHLAW